MSIRLQLPAVGAWRMCSAWKPHGFEIRNTCGLWVKRTISMGIENLWGGGFLTKSMGKKSFPMLITLNIRFLTALSSLLHFEHGELFFRQ